MKKNIHRIYIDISFVRWTLYITLFFLDDDKVFIYFNYHKIKFQKIPQHGIVRPALPSDLLETGWLQRSKNSNGWFGTEPASFGFLVEAHGARLY
jgi:hypothetical protein